MRLLDRFQSIRTSQKAGLWALCAGILVTLAWAQLAGTGGPLAGLWGTGTASVHASTGVRFTANLSQPMITQGGSDEVYLDLNVTTPLHRRTRHEVQPSDILIVLDRSGSMADGDKWRFATQAVRSLLQRLTPQDRIGLITFDTGVHLDSGLVTATSDHVRRLRGRLDEMGPGSSTNLGGALLLAERTSAEAASEGRRGRILLLSDGHANRGIVEPAQLQKIAGRIADRGTIVSTIGMGLGFNETVMASLADHGMGSFDYLEDLESLGTILTAQLDESRHLFADGSKILLNLPSNVEVLDTAGYPFEKKGSQVSIRSGQLLQDTTKNFMVTLRIPNHSVRDYAFGAIDLSYRMEGRPYRQRVERGHLQVACVAPERQQEVDQSVDKDLYREAWSYSNYGRLLSSVGDYLRRGEKAKAAQVMESYEKQIDEAEALAPGVKKENEAKLRDLRSKVDDAFQGAGQDVKQNRAAKSFLQEAQKNQRTSRPANR